MSEMTEKGRGAGVRHRELGQRIADWLTHDQAEVPLDEIEAAIFGGPHRREDDYWPLQALEAWANSDDPRRVSRAGELAARYVRAVLDDPDGLTANLVWRGLRAVESAAIDDEAELLAEVLDSPQRGWVRGFALRRLADLEGPEGLWRLRRALRDPELRQDAAEGLAEHPCLDASAVFDLTEGLYEADEVPAVMRPLIRALLRLETPEALEALEAVRERAEPWDRTRIAWLIDGVSPRRVAQRLVKAGVVEWPGDEVLQRLQERWEASRSAFDVVLELLGRDRVAWFDGDTGDPVRLVEDLAVVSDGSLRPVLVTRQDEGGEAVIRFVQSRRLFRFTAGPCGAEAPIADVLAALNATLATIGRAERFVRLYTGGQTWLVTCAPGRPFREACEALRIPVAFDQPEQAADGRATTDLRVDAWVMAGSDDQKPA